MEKLTPDNRAQLGCAYEPVLVQATPWSPISMNPKWGSELALASDEVLALPTICPGYTTSLPEVIEVARARVHWAKNALTQFCGGEQPNETLLACIELFEAENNEVERWCLENPLPRGDA